MNCSVENTVSRCQALTKKGVQCGMDSCQKFGGTFCYHHRVFYFQQVLEQEFQSLKSEEERVMYIENLKTILL
jgi:hypothetical protein